jgi:hypothetical protein
VTSLENVVNGVVEVDVDELRRYFKTLVKDRGATVSGIARQVNASHTAISLFLKGEKAGKHLVAKLAELKERWEAEVRLQDNAVPREYRRTVPDFIMTEDARQVLAVCDLCQAEREVGVVVGPAGTGKTTALLRFCELNPDAAYVRGDVSMTAKELLHEVGDRLGADVGQGSLRSVMRKISARLRERPSLLIIDEADLLVSFTVRKIELLRTIYDEAKMGLVLCGMPRLAGYLLRGPTMKENLAQFYSRVAYAAKLTGLSRREAEEILKDYDMTEAARKMLVNRALDAKRGGLRRFVKLLGRCLDLADGGKITREIVEDAGRLLLSLED